jgi:predicted HicB family RNase H-like nuclease
MVKPRRTDEMLQVQIPAATKKDLAIKAARAGEPLRTYVLKALAEYGVKVPATEIADRRKSKS